MCSKCAKRSSKIAAIDSSRAVINRSLVIYLLNPFCRFLLFNNSFKLPQTWSGICEKHNRIQLSQNVPSRAWKNYVNELDSDLKIGNNRKRFFVIQIWSVKLSNHTFQVTLHVVRFKSIWFREFPQWKHLSRLHRRHFQNTVKRNSWHLPQTIQIHSEWF